MQVLKNGVEDYCRCFPDRVPKLLLQATTLARPPWPCMRPWSPPLASCTDGLLVDQWLSCLLVGRRLSTHWDRGRLQSVSGEFCRSNSLAPALSSSCRMLYCFLCSMPLVRLIRWVTAFSGYEYIMPSYCWWLTCSGWVYTIGVCDPLFLVICLVSFLLLFLDRCL
jgi:hypothetical protein